MLFEKGIKITFFLKHVTKKIVLGIKKAQNRYRDVSEIELK